ncbi:MAG: CopG family transcriptional regulator [Blastocatellia bacterium]
MMTIQLSIDEPLLTEIDLVTQSLAITRADFIRQALEAALRKHQIRILEQRHREGYERLPQKPDEFEIPESDRVWEEA